MYSFSIIVLGLIPPILFFSIARLERLNGPSPMRVMGWTFLIGYSIKSVYLAYAVTSGAPFVASWVSEKTIDVGQLSIIVGVISLIFAYILTSVSFENRTITPKKITIPIPAIRYVYWAVFWFSLGLMVAYFYRMGFAEQLSSMRFIATKRFIDQNGVSSSLGFLTIGADFLVIFFVFRLLSLPRPSLWDIHNLAIAFCSLCYLLASRRNGIIIIVILYLLIRGHRDLSELRKRGDFSFKRIAVLTLAFLVLIAVGQIRKGGSEGQSLSNIRIGEAVMATTEHMLQGAYFLDPAKTAAIVQVVTEKNSFLLGSSFGNFVFTPIPRVLWPEKPSIRIGPYVAQEILDLRNNSGAPPGGIGEFFMNFGWLGVVVGPAILGIMLSRAWHRNRVSGDTVNSRIKYAIVVTCILLFLVGDFSVALLSLIKYQFAAAIAARYWSERARALR